VTSSATPTASIVIPTRDRADYLRVTLASVVPQARQHGAEVLVVGHGGDAATATVTRQFRVRLVLAPDRGSLNASRNAGADAARGDPVVLVDDDIEAPPGWLAALLAGVSAAPDHDVFGGPIRPRLEQGPRACGREPAPITALDFGPQDRDVALVWGANMAIRRRALERVGKFDEAMRGRGDEEDWERRYTAGGGRIRYVAAAGLDHRRSAADSKLGPLARAAYTHGRNGRRYDVRKSVAPALRDEVRTLLGCVWHIFRRRCAYGIVMTAEAAGRLRETLAGLR
jgi:glycosyltransferase involved in cell wall biosynthesis